ncbi:MAG TPA: sulfatase-like hydrolase/transferase [Terriglobales bacterium]|nr:sulfatase-like hydrolase/transferase [Terriglobales bacterium]
MIRRTPFSVSLALFCTFVLSAAATAASKPNLVLITLDSVRADRLTFLGGKGAATPNLNHLAEESIVFDHAYAQAPGTVVSHATILTGAYPQNTGLSEIGGALSPSLPSLPDLLKNQGYKTAAFVGSIELDPWNGIAQGLDRGFQSYDAGFRPVIPGDAKPTVTGHSGAEVVAHAAAWLGKNAPGPFFIWVHLNDASAARAASYNAAIAAEDAAVGKFLAALKTQKADTNTAIVLLADHGQSLGAHGEDTHGIFLYDDAIHVPLLIKLPEAQTGAKKVTAKVRLVDVAPTILEIASVPVPSQMQGQSLLRVAKSGGGSDQPVYSRSDLSQRGFGWSILESWRAGKYLYIRAPKPELYDMTADPAAAHNLAQSSKATMDTMASQLDSFDRKFSGQGGKSASELSSTEMQKLASLGYVGLQTSSGAVTTVSGTDPKDKIATANKVIDVTSSLMVPSKTAATVLGPVTAADGNLYLAEYTLGVAMAQKGQYADAAKHLHKAVGLQPDSGWAHYETGATLLKTGDFKTAAVHLEIATTRLPAFAPAHAALAQAYEKLGRADDAKKERTKAGEK